MKRKERERESESEEREREREQSELAERPRVERVIVCPQISNHNCGQVTPQSLNFHISVISGGAHGICYLPTNMPSPINYLISPQEKC